MVRISPTRIRILHSKSALQNWLGAGRVREQPHRVLARKALVTAHGSAPGGAAPFAATRERANFATCSKKNHGGRRDRRAMNVLRAPRALRLLVRDVC